MNTESRISRREFVKGSVAAALGSTAVAMAGCSNAVQPEHQFASGTYTGSAMGRAGEIAVEISVKNDCITKATLISNGDTAVISERAAEKILGDIVEYQTLEVDTVSGASLTSMAVISAAEQALEQAGDPAPFQSPAAYPARECEDCATDVVVAGAGSAGMNAAIRLADAGANVILVEKQGFLGGGDAVDAYISMGVPFGKFAKFSNTIIDGSSPGVHIIKRLAEQVNERGIDYRLNTKLVSVTREGDAVTGVVVANPDGEYAIGAGAVLLACGGFANNEDMLTEYADAASYCGLPHSGSASATGDGILAAKAIGADISNMTAIKANNICHITANGAVVSLAAIQGVSVLVDDTGRRFINETDSTVHEKSDAELKLPSQEAGKRGRIP